jgi:saccharopine dehydrogenase-like NADP-dependent oxidoreductase
MCTYIRNGRYKYVPYHRLFHRTERVQIDEVGQFEGYPNRDSLSYRAVYGLEDIPTIFRGTLRRPGFCQAWNVFVQLGATDDEIRLEDSENMTYRDFINSFLAYDPLRKVEDKLCDYVGITRDSDVFKKIAWLGVFEQTRIGLKHATAAEILQKILESKWQLAPNDKDMIVMQHQFEYRLNGKLKKLHSSLVTIGDDTLHTAMSKTVGLPLGIATKLLLQGKITQRGVIVPTDRHIYEPILEELTEFGVKITEKQLELPN